MKRIVRMVHGIVAIVICASLLATTLHVAPTFADGPYPDYPTFIANFKALATNYPQLVSYQTIGKTVLNQAILMFRIGNPAGDVVLFDGALHGYEVGGSQLLYFYAQWLLTSGDPLAQRILVDTCTLIVPVVNIDTYFTTRTNAHGVDLNRNFATDWQYGGDTDPTSSEYRGPAALSEPESQALETVFQTYKPSAYVNVHDGDGGMLYASYLTDSTYLSSVISKIDSLSVQRGVTSYGDPTVIGASGEAISDAAMAGARPSFVLELGADDTPLSQINALWLPRFIPIAAVLSKESGSGSTVLFSDSFESGDFGNWDGTQMTPKGSLWVTNWLSREGMHSAHFITEGGWPEEDAYCYTNLESSTSIFARGYFFAGSFAATADYSRFYFATFVASGQTVAMVGARISGGTIYWRLAVMNVSEWVIVDSEASQFLNRWHRFEFQLVQSPTDGYGKLYIDEDLVCSITRLDTTALGSVNSAQFGIAMSGNAKVSLYLDYVQVSTISPGRLPIPEDLNQDGRVDMLDLSIVARAFGVSPDSSFWDPRADMNGDLRIDMTDIARVAFHFG